MLIKPVADKKIPHPVRGGYLAPEGDEVNDFDVYWQRRLADGDVEKVELGKKPKSPD